MQMGIEQLDMRGRVVCGQNKMAPVIYCSFGERQKINAKQKKNSFCVNTNDVGILRLYISPRTPPVSDQVLQLWNATHK